MSILCKFVALVKILYYTFYVKLSSDNIIKFSEFIVISSVLEIH